ncbi:Remorin, C-terminal [Quillaja saponaria]|uniref:Remorin, C-terminal n=1 Tax=Quillaja saponaria TaxID=32244 RepID=A0AAD7LPT3_QUISA|nr:Remorin, C-terminal [Quillaja saponaria]
MQEMKSEQPTFKNTKKSPQMKIMKTMATCSESSCCNVNCMAASESKQIESHSACSSARTSTTNSKPKTRITHNQDRSIEDPVWSMSSLMADFPESPSPICSSSPSPLRAGTLSRKSDPFCSEIRTSSPIKQSFCTISIDYKQSNSMVEVDEWIKNASKFCNSSNYINYLKENEILKQNGSHEGDMSMLSKCRASFAAPDYELSNMTLPSVREGSSTCEDLSRCVFIHSIYGDSNSGTPMDDRNKVKKRLKPYNAFLDEVKKQMLETETDARNKAKHVKLMDKMRRKVAAIEDWEAEETRKAMKEMKELESKLEKKRIQVLQRTQEKICKVKEGAKKQKINARRSTLEKLSAASNISRTRSPRDSIGLRLVPIC